MLAEASDGAEAVALVREHSPTVALLDIRMPVLDGLRAAARSIALGLATRVLILTTFDADEYVYEALRAGVSGFLLKARGAEQLIVAGAAWRPGTHSSIRSVTRRLIPGSRWPRKLPARRRPGGAVGADHAEMDVFRLVARGLSNAEDRRSLVVEENTVKTHVSRILMKLDLRDRVQAVVLAYESGFITPDPGATPL